jgi:hypothetical protein
MPLFYVLWKPHGRKNSQKKLNRTFTKKTAIHRFASIDKVVDAYCFCIDNPFVNGSLIEVNGGYCLNRKVIMQIIGKKDSIVMIIN